MHTILIRIQTYNMLTCSTAKICTRYEKHGNNMIITNDKFKTISL